MSEHMFLTFCKLTLADASKYFLDSQVYMICQSPVEQYRLTLKYERREGYFGLSMKKIQAKHPILMQTLNL